MSKFAIVTLSRSGFVDFGMFVALLRIRAARRFDSVDQDRKLVRRAISASLAVRELYPAVALLAGRRGGTLIDRARRMVR